MDFGACNSSILAETNTAECHWDGGDCCHHFDDMNQFSQCTKCKCLDPHYASTTMSTMEGSGCNEDHGEYYDRLDNGICDDGKLSFHFQYSVLWLQVDGVTCNFIIQVTNIASCNWDGGDCCGENVTTTYCKMCECLDPTFHTSPITPLPTSSTTLVEVISDEEGSGETQMAVGRRSNLMDEDYDSDSDQGSGKISEDDEESSGDKKVIGRRSDLNFEEEESSGSEDNSALEDANSSDSSSEESKSKESDSKELESQGSYEENSKSVVAVGMFESDEMSAEIKDRKSKNSTSNSEKHPKSLSTKE